MSANGKIGIAIQGAGLVSSGHLNAYLRNPHTHVVAIGSRTLAGAEAKAREVGIDPATINLYDDVDALLADPALDALSICTPPQLHAAEGIAAARAGKHFLIEKPISMNNAELLDLDTAVRESGVKTVCGFVLRYNPMVETAHRLIQDNMFGELLYIQADYWHNPVHSGYPAHPDASAMMLGGVHALDMARYLMSCDIAEVSAFETSHDPAAPFPGNQTAIVKFTNGRIGKISACVEHWAPYQFNIDLLGTDGGMRDNRFYGRKLVGATDWATFPTITPNSGLVTHHPFDAEIDHFVNCIRAGVESHGNVRDGVNTHKAVFAIDESSKRGGEKIEIS